MFLSTCFKYCSPGLPMAFFPDIAPSRMFTTNSLCLTVCPIHEWRLFLKVIFLLSPFEKHHSLFYLSIVFLTFLSSCMFQMHLRPSLHFFIGSMCLIHKEQHSKYNFLNTSLNEILHGQYWRLSIPSSSLLLYLAPSQP